MIAPLRLSLLWLPARRDTSSIARGLDIAEIAGQLHLSEGMVRNHVSGILDKLGVSDRTQAAGIAIKHGLGN